MSRKCEDCGYVLRKNGKQNKITRNENGIRNCNILHIKRLKIENDLCNYRRLISYLISSVGLFYIDVDTEQYILRFQSSNDVKSIMSRTFKCVTIILPL